MKKLLFSVFLATIVQTVSMAQIVPVHFGVNGSIYNEFGVLLDGTASNPGAVVQFLNATAGVFPPDVNGNPHPDNPILGVSHIGLGTAPHAGPMGKVSGALTLARGSGATKIVARVFNKTTVEDSSFYTDSQVFDIPEFGDTYGIFLIDASQTSTELDTSDDDGDGLSRSWERSLGSDPNNPDSDDDGMLDGDEFLAGTDLLDPSSLLMMVELIPASGGNLIVMWDSVPGKTYQLQYATGSTLTDDASFTDINDPVTATGDSAYTTILSGEVPSAVNFRVRLIP